MMGHRIEVFICSHIGDRCLCGNIPTLLCDHVLDDGTTCDAPLCKACSVHIAGLDFCTFHPAQLQLNFGEDDE